jgi:predicted lipid carrier protein YhbT
MLKPRTHLVNLGSRLLPLAAKTPFLLQRLALERSLNQVFAEALADGAFDVLDARWMKLEVCDLGLAWCLTCANGRLRIAEHAPVEVSIRGNWREFLLLASRQEDPDTLFFRRRLIIEGDTELGLAIKNGRCCRAPAKRSQRPAGPSQPVPDRGQLFSKPAAGGACGRWR